MLQNRRFSLNSVVLGNSVFVDLSGMAPCPAGFCVSGLFAQIDYDGDILAL